MNPKACRPGKFATLLDSSRGCAVHAALPAGKGGTRMVTAGGGHRLLGADDTLYAHASIIRFNFNTP